MILCTYYIISKRIITCILPIMINYIFNGYISSKNRMKNKQLFATFSTFFARFQTLNGDERLALV